MKERPILFSDTMVQTILAGRKTQTRRVIKPQPTIERRAIGEGASEVVWTDTKRMRNVGGGGDPMEICVRDFCPYGAPGDRLWVREAWQEMRLGCDYRADYPDRINFRWRPSIHMPRSLSRITLEVVGVRVERLQEISEADAMREGLLVAQRQMTTMSSSCSVSSWRTSPDVLGEGPEFSSHKDAYADLWDAINAKRGYPWESNPWVWVIEFRR